MTKSHIDDLHKRSHLNDRFPPAGKQIQYLFVTLVLAHWFRDWPWWIAARTSLPDAVCTVPGIGTPRTLDITGRLAALATDGDGDGDGAEHDEFALRVALKYLPEIPSSAVTCGY